MERQSPPFGAIPGYTDTPNTNSYVSDTAVDLSNVQVLPSGIFATLRVATRAPNLQEAVFAFETHDDPRIDQLQVVVTASDNNAQVPANLVTGTRGWDDGLDASHYTLWFPIDIQSLTGTVTINLTWPDADLTANLILTADQLQNAASQAIIV